MKILYTSDLHVDQNHYQRLFNLIKVHPVDSLIIGGDLIPNQRDFFGRISNQRDFIVRSLGPFMKKLKENHSKLSIYVMMGNDDLASNMDLLEEMEDQGTLNLIHNRHYLLEEELCLVGYGFVPVTPFSLKDWERFDTREKTVVERPRRAFFSTRKGMEEIDLETELGKKRTIEEDMEHIAEMSDPKGTIYVMHAPPFNTALDRLYNGNPVGSKAIRYFIETHQPYLTLHGHIHESPLVTGRFIEEIGKTISLNPGQEAGTLHAVVFDTQDIKKSMQYFD